MSRLVRLARLDGEVDVRCLPAGSVTLDNPAAGPGIDTRQSHAGDRPAQPSHIKQSVVADAGAPN
ncbi:hypothetical protein [Amycolatopsis mediterranei]|uniref:hypothetical protein n=1 Tax=Amycolatopsis mediterranei TaxID=33910 RepID=UPI000A94399A